MRARGAGAFGWGAYAELRHRISRAATPALLGAVQSRRGWCSGSSTTLGPLHLLQSGSLVRGSTAPAAAAAWSLIQDRRLPRRSRLPWIGAARGRATARLLPKRQAGDVSTAASGSGRLARLPRGPADAGAAPGSARPSRTRAAVPGPGAARGSARVPGDRRRSGAQRAPGAARRRPGARDPEAIYRRKPRGRGLPLGDASASCGSRDWRRHGAGGDARRRRLPAHAAGRTPARRRRRLGGESRGIGRWLGGVHLQGTSVPWRWDEGASTVC